MQLPLDEVPQNFRIPAIKVQQPIGSFYIGSIDSELLVKITSSDVRRMIQEREIETYLGVQRPLSNRRVKELREYVKTVDACFPTAVILAVSGRCAAYDETARELVLSNDVDPENNEEPILSIQIARVLDGQHRIEGLRDYKGEPFQVNLSIFIDIDIESQAYIFSTVNLAQTKVNKSLVYDLFDLANSRSPQKTAHNIAVALDQNLKSPFYKRIKRLGVATEGRFYETITQATFVEALLPYISANPQKDRDDYLRKRVPPSALPGEAKIFIFREMFLKGEDLKIIDVIWNYFDAVKARWPTAWNYSGTGLMLNRTNGFKALMRVLRPAYLRLSASTEIPTTEQFLELFQRFNVTDDHFTIDTYKPGTSGEAALYWALINGTGLEEQRSLK